MATLSEIRGWTPDMVLDWLDSVGLSVFAPDFTSMGVDGGDLLDNISDHSLDCFRFAHSRERQRLLAEIDRLRRRPSSIPKYLQSHGRHYGQRLQADYDEVVEVLVDESDDEFDEVAYSDGGHGYRKTKHSRPVDLIDYVDSTHDWYSDGSREVRRAPRRVRSRTPESEVVYVDDDQYWSDRAPRQGYQRAARTPEPEVVYVDDDPYWSHRAPRQGYPQTARARGVSGRNPVREIRVEHEAPGEEHLTFVTQHHARLALVEERQRRRHVLRPVNGPPRRHVVLADEGAARPVVLRRATLSQPTSLRAAPRRVVLAQPAPARPVLVQRKTVAQPAPVIIEQQRQRPVLVQQAQPQRVTYSNQARGDAPETLTLQSLHQAFLRSSATNQHPRWRERSDSEPERLTPAAMERALKQRNGHEQERLTPQSMARAHEALHRQHATQDAQPSAQHRPPPSGGQTDEELEASMRAAAQRHHDDEGGVVTRQDGAGDGAGDGPVAPPPAASGPATRRATPPPQTQTETGATHAQPPDDTVDVAGGL